MLTSHAFDMASFATEWWIITPAKKWISLPQYFYDHYSHQKSSAGLFSHSCPSRLDTAAKSQCSLRQLWAACAQIPLSCSSDPSFWSQILTRQPMHRKRDEVQDISVQRSSSWGLITNNKLSSQIQAHTLNHHTSWTPQMTNHLEFTKKFFRKSTIDWFKMTPDGSWAAHKKRNQWRDVAWLKCEERWQVDSQGGFAMPTYSKGTRM